MRTKRKSYKYDSSDYDNGDYGEDDFDEEEDDFEDEDQQDESHHDSDYDNSNAQGPNAKKNGNAKQSKSTKNKKKEENEEEQDDSYEDEDPFSPEIDQILADKQVEIQLSPTQVQGSIQQNPNSNKNTRNPTLQPQVKKTNMFLVKFTDQSFLHVKWMEESELEEYSYRAKQKIRRYFNAKEKKRFIQEHTQRQAITFKPAKNHHFSDDEEEEDEDEDAAIKGINLPDLPIIEEEVAPQEAPKPNHIQVFGQDGEELTQYFDKSYVAVERILSTTLLFPVIHPRQAKQIKGKWQDDCLKVVNVVANFRKNNVAIGLAFCEQLDSENEDLAQYFKIIKQPIDLVMIMNKLYTKQYQQPQEFWNDLGLLFRNCRTYYKSQKRGLRKQCDALRCLAFHLYNDWYNEQRQRFVTGVALPPAIPEHLQNQSSKTIDQPITTNDVPAAQEKQERETGSLVVNLSSLLNKNLGTQEQKKLPQIDPQPSINQDVSQQQQQQLQQLQQPQQQLQPPQSLTPSTLQNQNSLYQQSIQQQSQQQQLLQQQQQQQQMQMGGFPQQQQQNFGMQNQMMPPPSLPQQQLQQQQMNQTPSLPSINQLINPMSQLNNMSAGMGGGFNQGFMDQSQLGSNTLPGQMLPGLNQQQMNSLQQMRPPTNMINPQQQTQDFLQNQQLELQRQLQAQIDPSGTISLPSFGQVQQNVMQNQLMNQLNPFQKQQFGMMDPQIQALQQQQDQNLSFFNQMMNMQQQNQLGQLNQYEMMQLMAQQQQQEQLAMAMRQGMAPGQLPSLNSIPGLGQSHLGGGFQLPSLSSLGQYGQQMGGGFDPFQQSLMGMMQNPAAAGMINPMMQQPGMGGMMKYPQFNSTMNSSNAYDEMSMMLNNLQQQQHPNQIPGLQQPGFNPFGQDLSQNNQLMGYQNQLSGQMAGLQQHQQNMMNNQYGMRNQNNQVNQAIPQASQPQQPQIRVVDPNLIQPDNNDQYNDKQQDPPVPPCIIDPGQYDLSWLLEQGETPESIANSQFITQQEIDQVISMKSFVDQLYLVKWKSLSYNQATWEQESVLKGIYEEKISEYYKFNRSLDQNQREKLDSLIKTHKKMLRVSEKKYNSKKIDPHQEAIMQLNQGKLQRQLLNQKIQDIMGPAFYQIVQYSEKDGIVPQFKRPQYKLKDYQIAGLNWLIRAWHSHRNIVLADEMGLGKTIMTLSLFEHFNRVYKLKGPYLILAPLTTLEHWKRIAEEWTTLNSILYYDPGSAEGRAELRYQEWFYTDITYKGQVTQKSELFKFNIIITSFEVFMQDLNPILQEIPFLYIVVDEAHRLKNKQAKTLKLLKDHPCKRILLLTGTPVQNNTKELWTLLNYIEPEKFHSQDDFLENYGNLENYEQIQKLHTMLKPHFLRRLKEEVDNSIPPLQETVIEVGLTTVQNTYYKGIYGENRMMLAKFGTNSIKTSQLNNIDVQLRKCCNHLFLLKGVEEELTRDCKSEEDMYKKLLESSGKLMLLDKFIEKFKKENHKMLIFSQFKRMLDIIELYLKMKAVPYEKLTGSVKTQDRISAIQRFNDDKTFGVFLLTTRAGGLGINLTSARVVIIFDSDWNPQNDLQAIARAHRIGQKFEVQVFRLITSKTYEEQMFERASKKLGMEQALFSKGAFHQNDGDEFSQLHLRGFQELKQDSKEIENLLKYGAYAFMEEGDDDQMNFNKDIDEILATGKKKEFMYSKGIYTLQKSTFNAAKYENLPDFDDPDFWNKVLPLDSIMSIGMLEKRFKKEKKEMGKNEKLQKDFFKDLEIVFNDFMDAKFDPKTSAGTKKQLEADEEKLREILKKMVKLNGMKLLFVEKCKEWMREMLRTNKRKKPLQTMFQDEDDGGIPKQQSNDQVHVAPDEDDDQDMMHEEDDIIIYDSDEQVNRNRTLRKRNPVVHQPQPKLDFDEPLLKKRGRKPKNANLNMQQKEPEAYEDSEGEEEEDNYGDEEDKNYNEKGGKKGHAKDDDYGDSDEGGYGLRHQRKRQKLGRDNDNMYMSQSQHAYNNQKHLPKINDQIVKRNEKNGIVCSYCLQPETIGNICTYFCQGYCQRFFHEECKDQMFQNGEQSKRRNRLNQSQATWQCDDCLDNKSVCFCCKIKGQILLFPKKGKPKAAGYPDNMHINSNNLMAEDDNQDDDDNMLMNEDGNDDNKDYGEELDDDLENDMDMDGIEQPHLDGQLENHEEEPLIDDTQQQQDISPQDHDQQQQNKPEEDKLLDGKLDHEEEKKLSQDQEDKDIQDAVNQDEEHKSVQGSPKSVKSLKENDADMNNDIVDQVQQPDDLEQKDQDQEITINQEDQQEVKPDHSTKIVLTNISMLPKKDNDDKLLSRNIPSPEPEPNDKRYVVRCTLGGCFKYYHVDCVYQNKNVSCINSMKVQRFRCPLHYCEICQASGDSVLIVQCINCPTAYHLKCLPQDLKAIRLTKKYIICGKHEMSPENFPKYEEKSGAYVSVRGLNSLTPGGQNSAQKGDKKNKKKKLKKRGRKPKNAVAQDYEDASDDDDNGDDYQDGQQQHMFDSSQQIKLQPHLQHTNSSSVQIKLENNHQQSRKDQYNNQMLSHSNKHLSQYEDGRMNSSLNVSLKRQNSADSGEMRSIDYGNNSNKQQHSQSVKLLFAVEKGTNNRNQNN